MIDENNGLGKERIALSFLFPVGLQMYGAFSGWIIKEKWRMGQS
jgi:hypothetical protein